MTTSPSQPIVGRILHLGLSNFHRAHQVVYLQRLKDQGETGWQLAGTNIRPDANPLLEALAAQDGNFTLETIDPHGKVEYHWITAIDQVIPYDASLKTITELATDPITRIISFTVTEAGYYLLENGDLDTSFPDLKADLERVKKGEPGQTLYGALITLLRARKQAGGGPITLQNCDNLRHNGDRVRGGLRDFAQKIGDTDILSWIDANVRFPNAMVDRITPRPPAELKARVKAATGRDDNAALGSESYLQWVIEDNFAAAPPGKRWAQNWWPRSIPTRKRRSACSMPPTAALPGAAHCADTSTSMKGRVMPWCASWPSTTPPTT